MSGGGDGLLENLRPKFAKLRENELDGPDFRKEFDVQRKEHPSLPDSAIRQISLDHLRLGKGK
jgi:hypothetical protein